MKRSRQFTILLAGLSMAGLISAACDSGTKEPAAPADGTAKSAATDDTEAREPDVIPKERYPKEIAPDAVAAIPEIFPKEVPIYPGAVPAQGRGRKVDGVPMSALQLMSLDSSDKVYDYYIDKLTKEGWTIEDHKGFAEKHAVSAVRGDCKASMIAVPTEDGGSNIFIFTEC